MAGNASPWPWAGQEPRDPNVGLMRGVAVTPGDAAANNLPFMARNLVATGAGTAALVLADGTTVVTVTLAVNTPLPVNVCFIRVNNTGTSATGITALQ